MMDRRAKHARWRWASRAPWIVLAAVALYVLSMGPVYWLFFHDYIEFDTYLAIYQPIHYVCNRSDRLQEVHWYYLQLFRAG